VVKIKNILKSKLIYIWLLGITAVLIIVFINKVNNHNIIKYFGHYAFLVVLSDSMSPSIKAGDIVVVTDRDLNQCQKGDVVTFREPGSINTIVTHRVIDEFYQKGEKMYRTKGDANKYPDEKPVPQSFILGKKVFKIPLLGYLTEFSKSKLGFIIFVLIPAGLLILEEINVIFKEVKNSTESGG